MIRRAGVTLTEVLVAIFITGIGLMSLIVLFPLGYLNMAQAIKDQRTADASRVGEALAAAFDLRNDAKVWNNYNVAPAPSAGGPSWPVYIDPRGARIAGDGSKVGGITGITRIFPDSTTLLKATGNGVTTGIDFSGSSPASLQAITRWTTLQDELVFDVDGAPKTIGTPAVVEQTPRYSWAWMCQQTKANSLVNPTPGGVFLTVVVYDRRPLVPGGAGLQEEVACSANFKLTTNVVTLTWTTTAPQLKRGSWILDVASKPGSTGTTPHGFWYRVVNVTPTSATSADVELHMVPRLGGNSDVVVIDSVVEVFEKGQ